MSFFVKSTPAPKLKTARVFTVSVALAAVFTVLAVAQLFTFETFPEVITQMWLPFDELASVWAAIIVTLEVAAVPFLLRMRLSKAMRVLSMAAGWLAIVVWLGISVWLNVSGNVVVNSGFFGDTVALPVGWWSVLFCVALGIASAWVSWGMWPQHRNRVK